MIKQIEEKAIVKINEVETIKEKIPDLILLDWMLPDLSGIKICQYLKQDKTVKDIPIIMLTAKGEEEDKVKGLNTGAEDYVTKPFSFPELLARIKSILRRVKPSTVSDEASYLDLKIDRIAIKVYRKDKEINLGPKEYKLLNFMIKHFGGIEGIDFIQMGPEDQSRAEIINIIEDKYDDLERQGINIS